MAEAKKRSVKSLRSEYESLLSKTAAFSAETKTVLAAADAQKIKLIAERKTQLQALLTAKGAVSAAMLAAEKEETDAKKSEPVAANP